MYTLLITVFVKSVLTSVIIIIIREKRIEKMQNYNYCYKFRVWWSNRINISVYIYNYNYLIRINLLGDFVEHVVKKKNFSLKVSKKQLIIFDIWAWYVLNTAVFSKCFTISINM